MWRVLAVAQLLCLFGVARAGDAPAPIDFTAEDVARCGPLEMVGAKNTDKAGKTTTLSLEDALKTIETDPNAPFAKYANYGFLTKGTAITGCWPKIGFRYSDGDRCTVEHLMSRLRFFDDDTAVLMSTGGAHSIAMAAELIKDGHHQPIWKLGSELHPNAGNPNGQDIGAFKYNLPDFVSTKPLPGAPPVFIMDQHRGDKPFEDGMYDNSAEFGPSEYPSSAEFKARGIKKILWVVEGKTDAEPILVDDARFKSLADGTSGYYELYDDDPLVVLRSYAADGLVVYQLRISPYDCPYSRHEG